jgi:glycine/D-amino acid oxidase-like deaminating enzyme
VGCALSSPRSAPEYAGLSLWHETAGDDWSPRAALPGDTQADVAIVGAGLTGLWTAYYLLRDDPTLRVVVLEAETAGFGASGRNGGWCSALFPAGLPKLASLPGSSRARALAQHRAMRATVDEVLRVTGEEGIDARAHKGGTIKLARSRSQVRRAHAEVGAARAWGRDEDELRLLDQAEASERLRATDVLGATFTPDCAAVHPARLVRGLALAVERRGGRIYEHTRVRSLEPRRAVTAHGVVSADVVIRATEGYTTTLEGMRRDVVPVYSLVVATEPLPESTWDRIGLRDRETFSDYRNLIVYGQRTADGRLVFGGRGAPYHFGSGIRPGYDREPRVFSMLRSTLVAMFPVLEGVRFTHAWGGALGTPRDWVASVGLDRGTGIGWAGGYVGDGVGTTNLAGRTLRDLVLERDTDLTALPWVGHRSRRWEPEPLRWLGVNAGLRAMTFADAEERLTRRPSLVARAVAPLVGGQWRSPAAASGPVQHRP